VAEVIDTLEIDLTIKPDAASMAAAAKHLKKLEKASDDTADAAKELADQQKSLKGWLRQAETATRSLATQEKKLTAEIARAGVPTREQARQLEAVRHRMREAGIASVKYARDLREVGRAQDEVSRKSVRLGRAQRTTRGGMAEARGTMQSAAAGGEGWRAEARSKFSAAQRPTLGATMDSAREVGAAGLAAGGMVAKGAAAGTALLGAVVLKTSADFEKMRTQIRNLEGDEKAAEKSFANITKFAKETPYSLEQVTAGFIKLRAMGLDASNDSMRAYGDLAATMGKSMDEVINAVADAATGEFERLKEFGIKAKTVGDNVQFTFKGVTTTVKKNAESIEDYIQKVGKMEGVGGAMAGQMSTAYGMISNLQDSLAQFFDEVGRAGVLDEFKGLLSDISGVAGEDGGGLAKILASGLVDAIKSLREIVQDLTAEDIKGWFTAARDVMLDVADGIRFLWDAFSTIVDISGGVGKAFANITLAAIALQTAFMGPVGLVVAAGAVGMAIGNMLNAMGATDYLDNLLGSVTGLNAELRALAGNVPHGKRGAPGFAVSAENTAVDKEGNLVKQDLVQFTKKGEVQTTERSTLMGIAAGEIKSEGLSQQEASHVLEQIYAEDLAGLSKRAAAKGEVTAAKVERAKGGKKGKKGAKVKDDSLAHEIDEQLKSTAREMARRDTARALQQGKITNAEMRDYEKNSYESRLARTRERFAETHELPAGIASDLAQIRRLPNEEDLVGRTQAPVISITNKITNIRDNEFVMQVTGTFSGTAEALATEALGSFRRKMEMELGGAYPDYVGPERL
jgi:phage tail tape-measure protein